MRSVRNIGLLLLGVVLLPTVIYVSYEVSALNEKEALLVEIYDQQMETILFSVNQRAWDVVDSWAGQLSRQVDRGTSVSMQQVAERFLEDNRAASAVFLADTLLRETNVYTRWEKPKTEDVLPLNMDLVTRLLDQKRAGFRKLEPLILNENGADEDSVAVVFVAEMEGKGSRLLGVVLNTQVFVDDVLAPKLQEVAREQFLLGVFRVGVQEPVYATGAIRLEEAKRQRPVWLFPDHVMGIRMQGASVGEVMQTRFRRELALAGVMAVVLLFAVWVVFRAIRKQVELARMKSDFVSNVSHELRTPLALIRMFAETLEMGRVPGEDKKLEYYRIIGAETERLTHLVNNILNFSRIEAGRKTYTLASVDLNALVYKVVDHYDHRLQQLGFEKDVRLAEVLPLVQADAEAIEEALINLVDNAIKYSHQEKHLTLRTGVSEEGVYVEVADRGIGIKPEEQRKVFDKFYRISTGLVHTTKGTGLGLALVRHIMEAHGGAATVSSTPGKGSRFRLLFPRT